MDKNRIAVQLFDKYASDYAAKYMDVGLYTAQLDRLCGLLPVDASVLELACGPGNVTKYIFDKRKDIQMLATDLSEKMIAIAANHNPTAQLQLLDCRHFNRLERQFDAIICAFGLPYVSKDEAASMIADASNSLNQNGILFLSFMSDDYTRSGWHTSSKGDELFLYYHEQEYIVETLLNRGFEIDTLSRIESFMNGTPVTDLIIISIKK